MDRGLRPTIAAAWPPPGVRVHAPLFCEDTTPLQRDFPLTITPAESFQVRPPAQVLGGHEFWGGHHLTQHAPTLRLPCVPLTM